MAELADAQDLGSCEAIRVGSTPTTIPSRRERPIVRGDFLQKSPLTHFAAAPLQTATALLGCGLVLDANP